MKRPRSRLFVFAIFGALFTAPVPAQTTERLSVSSSGRQGDGYSYHPSMSADGNCVAFTSTSTNLVPGGRAGVYLHDLHAGTTEIVSVDSAGTPANMGGDHASVSEDGRYVAFASQADNLVPGDTNGAFDVFLRDRQTGSTERVSVATDGSEGDGESEDPSISADGRFVAFRSFAENLVRGDTNWVYDVFVRDRLLGTTERVSVGPNGAEGTDASVLPSITPDGRYVAFYSRALSLVPLDTNGCWDVFIRDRQTGTTERVSVGLGGIQGNSDSGNNPTTGSSPSMSADGRFVTFSSRASNLVGDDLPGSWDTFLRDRERDTTERLGWYGSASSISPDGRFVAFASGTPDNVPGDTNGFQDVFARDRQGATTTRVSVATDGTQGDGDWFMFFEPTISISADGRRVAFATEATNLVPGDTNALSDIFVRDRGDASAFVAFCRGDGTGAACPCSNFGAPARGCENSAGTGGALLTGAGVASLSADTVQLTSLGAPADALCVVFQGRTAIAAAAFGDGLRCTSGDVERLYARSAPGGTVTIPRPADPTLSARSAANGDPIPLGATRNYQVYYRDPSASFCPDPPGGSFNVSNAIAIAWGA